jgi:hypothetical protein
VYTKKVFVENQPLHTNQTLSIDNETRIQLNIRINYELEEQIIKQKEKVRIIEPLELNELIK